MAIIGHRMFRNAQIHWEGEGVYSRLKPVAGNLAPPWRKVRTAEALYHVNKNKSMETAIVLSTDIVTESTLHIANYPVSLDGDGFYFLNRGASGMKHWFKLSEDDLAEEFMDGTPVMYLRENVLANFPENRDGWLWYIYTPMNSVGELV